VKKIIYITVSLLIASAIFIACSKQEIQNSEKPASLKVEGMVIFDAKTKKISLQEFKSDAEKKYAIASRIGEKEDFHVLRSTFTSKNKTSIKSTSKSTSKSEARLIVDPSAADGIYEMFLDEDLIYSVEVSNGIIITEIVPESTAYLSRAYPC
jgi:predicted transposase YbfD/YdcC